MTKHRRNSLPGFVATAALEHAWLSTYVGVAATSPVDEAVRPALCDPRECRRHCLRDVCDQEWGGIGRCVRGRCQCICF
jgi:hypothetical protein